MKYLTMSPGGHGEMFHRLGLLPIVLPHDPPRQWRR